MTYKIFLSVVIVLRSQSDDCKKILTDVSSVIAKIVNDYEIIVIDNASNDDTISSLKRLTNEQGIPNLQVYALTKQVELDTASWVGIENALGDFTLVINPLLDDINFLPEMLNNATGGFDVVFAKNSKIIPQRLFYRVCYAIFNRAYKLASGIDLSNDAPQFKIVSRTVVNFILQHPRPVLAYKHLPVTGGFSRINLDYKWMPKVAHTKRLSDDFNRGMRLLFSTTRLPMRLVTLVSLFAASANFLYAIYVISIAIFKSNVAPGWISLSLQQSGMFFLMSIVLFVLGEYILQMVSLINEGPSYHIAHEFTSDRMTRHEKLNIEEKRSKS